MADRSMLAESLVRVPPEGLRSDWWASRLHAQLPREEHLVPMGEWGHFMHLGERVTLVAAEIQRAPDEVAMDRARCQQTGLEISTRGCMCNTHVRVRVHLHTLAHAC